jgi:6-phosphogluconate dehydrogenase
MIQELHALIAAHVYEQTDRAGAFHIRWSTDGEEVRV